MELPIHFLFLKYAVSDNKLHYSIILLGRYITYQEWQTKFYPN